MFLARSDQHKKEISNISNSVTPQKKTQKSSLTKRGNFFQSILDMKKNEEDRQKSMFLHCMHTAHLFTTEVLSGICFKKRNIQLKTWKYYISKHPSFKQTIVCLAGLKELLTNPSKSKLLFPPKLSSTCRVLNTRLINHGVGKETVARKQGFSNSHTKTNSA